MDITMRNTEKMRSSEMMTKQHEIDKVIAETKKELGLQQFFDTVKDFFSNPLLALKNLFNEVKGEAEKKTQKMNTVAVQPKSSAQEYIDSFSFEGIDIPKAEFVKQFLSYIQHQQGAAGTNEIVQSILMGRPVNGKILSNMRSNVGSDFPGGKQNVNGRTFITYRYKKFVTHYKTRAHKKLPYEHAINEASKLSGTPKEIIKTIIGLESKGDALANKNNGRSYKGLMQVDIRQVKKYGVTDIYDPMQNIMMALKLRQENEKQLNKLTPTIPALIAKVALPVSGNIA